MVASDATLRRWDLNVAKSREMWSNVICEHLLGGDPGNLVREACREVSTPYRSSKNSLQVTF